MILRIFLACSISFASVLLGDHAFAIEKELSFKNLTIGRRTSIAAVEGIFEKQSYTFHSCYPDGNGTTYSCLGDVYVGQYHATATIDVKDNEIEQIAIMLHKNFYSEIRDGLIEKYGPPEKRDSEVVKNGYGAEFMSENSYLANAKSDELYLSSIFGKVDQSGFIMSTKKYRDRKANSRKLKGGDL